MNVKKHIFEQNNPIMTSDQIRDLVERLGALRRYL